MVGFLMLQVSKLAVAFNFFQFIAMTGTLRARWPPFMHDLLSVLTVWNLNLELFQMDCFVYISFLTRTVIYLVTPAMLIGSYILIFVAANQYTNRRYGIPLRSVNLCLCLDTLVVYHRLAVPM